MSKNKTAALRAKLPGPPRRTDAPGPGAATQFPTQSA